MNSIAQVEGSGTAPAAVEKEPGSAIESIGQMSKSPS